MGVIGVPSSVDTDLSLFFALETDLLAYTEDPPVGTVATAEDTSATFVWNGVYWRSLNASTVTVGTGTPAASAGQNGDIQFDFGNSAVYEKVSGTWTYEGTFGQLGGAQDPYYFSTASTSAVTSGTMGMTWTGALSAATAVHFNTTNADTLPYHMGQTSQQNTYFRVMRATDATVFISFRWTGTIAGGPGLHGGIDVIDFSSSSPFTNGEKVVVSWVHSSGAWLTGSGTPSSGIGQNGDFNIDSTGYLWQKQSGTWVNVLSTRGGYHNTFDIVSTSATSTIFTQDIPVLAANSAVLVFIEGDYLNNTGTTKTMEVSFNFGGTLMWGDTTNAATSSTTHYPFKAVAQLQNENSTSAQRIAVEAWLGGLGTATAGIGGFASDFGAGQQYAIGSGTATVDTTSAQTLLLTVKHSANSANLEFKGACTVVVIP